MIFCLGSLMVEVVLVACPEALGFLRVTAASATKIT